MSRTSADYRHAVTSPCLQAVDGSPAGAYGLPCRADPQQPRGVVTGGAESAVQSHPRGLPEATVHARVPGDQPHGIVSRSGRHCRWLMCTLCMRPMALHAHCFVTDHCFPLQSKNVCVLELHKRSATYTRADQSCMICGRSQPVA